MKGLQGFGFLPHPDKLDGDPNGGPKGKGRSLSSASNLVRSG
jgi:hypothetical protein